MRTMHFFRAVYLFLVAFLRVSAWALAGCFTVILTVLGWFGWMVANAEPNDRESYFWTGYGDDDGYAPGFGRTLTPGEDGCSTAKHKRYL